MTAKETTRIPLTIDRETLAKIDQISKREREFEGNRSLFIRRAMYELITRFDKREEGEKAA